MVSLTRRQEMVLAQVVQELEPIAEIAAIVLGGSFARNRARADSDLDIGIYYRDRAPFSIPAIRGAAARLNDSNDPVVCEFGEWGPWVDGGAWLTVRGQRVDLLYRSLDRVETVLHDARAGRYELHYGQQPPFGFFGPTYLGEIRVAIPLQDPRREIARMQAAVATYPQALRRAVVQNCLWGVEFGLAAFAPKFAAAADSYGVAGCLARFAFYLVLALFALNRTYPVNDKTALIEIEEFARAPADFRLRVQRLLGHPGETPAALEAALVGMQALFDETALLAGDLYRPGRLPR